MELSALVITHIIWLLAIGYRTLKLQEHIKCILFIIETLIFPSVTCIQFFLYRIANYAPEQNCSFVISLIKYTSYI